MKTDTKGLLTVFGVIKRPEFEKKKVTERRWLLRN